MNNVRKSIGWADYTINPVKGLCPMSCPYCYARRFYKRKANKVFRDPTIRFTPEVFKQINIEKPSKIFVGSTIELFGEWINEQWMETIFKWCGDYYKEHTFQFLSKFPFRLKRWSPFPSNCWVGATVTANGDASLAYQGLTQVKAPVRFISFEPLHGQIGGDELRNLSHVTDWWIIGPQTPYSKRTAPRIEWVKEIVDAADNAGIPVFLKNNLWKVLFPDALNDDSFWASEKAKLRQEFPMRQER